MWMLLTVAFKISFQLLRFVLRVYVGIIARSSMPISFKVSFSVV